MVDKAPKLSILLLDDSQTQLSHSARHLRDAGYEVATALTVPEALAQLSERDLVIVDFHMPGMQGPEALTALRKQRAEGLAYYLYTSDTDVAVGFKGYGFDGAFTRKGDHTALVEQMSNAARLLTMRRFMQQRRSC